MGPPDGAATELGRVIDLLPGVVGAEERGWAASGRAAHHLELGFVPNGRIVDLGGGVSAPLLALARLGMEVHVVDDFGQAYYERPEWQEAIALFEKAGVRFHRASLDDCTFDFVADRSVDRLVSYDCFEHLHSSPRRVLERATPKLVSGGRLVVGVPNAVNALKRIRVVAGRTNLAPFDDWWLRGDPFRGHVREWTAGELLEMAGRLGLRKARVEGRNWFAYQRREGLPLPLVRLADRLLRLRPGLSSNLYLVAEAG